LEAQAAILRVELQEKMAEFQEKNDRRETLRQMLAPDVLKGRLQVDSKEYMRRSDVVSEAWKNNAVTNEAFLRDFLDSMAAAYAIQSKLKLMEGDG